MVSFGVSRACDTCKKRRRKCDETRPACLRCVRSRRPCPGYRDDSSLMFRHYSAANTPTDTPALQRWTPTTDHMLESTAIHIFLDEMVVRTLDRSQSRGFLDGMHDTFATSAPDSMLMSAAKVAVLASLANRYRRDSLFSIVRKQYGQLLKEYVASLSIPSESSSVEQFFTAVLLGIYELMACNSTSPTRHSIHVQGLGSILQRGISSPPSTSKIGIHLPGTWLVTKGAMTLTRGAGILGSPLDDNPQRSLDQIMVKLTPLTSRSEQLSAEPSPSREALLELYHDLIEFTDEVAHWGDDQPLSWGSELAGYVLQDASKNCDTPWVCPGPVEKYFDMYVATAWNSWRSLYIVWLDQLYHVSNALGRFDLTPPFVTKMNNVIIGVKSSIPYFLSRNVEEYVQQVNAGKHTVHPDRLSGTLMLFHHMYSIGRCTIVDAETRQYLGDTLRWIGNEMGIGNAAVLADCLQPSEQGPSVMQSSKISFMDALEGYYLTTASMMSESR